MKQHTYYYVPLATWLLLATASGCCSSAGNAGCGSCDMSGSACGAYDGVAYGGVRGQIAVRKAARPFMDPEAAFSGPAGPPSATYGYPYYTVRAPRDFLVDNPPSIGR